MYELKIDKFEGPLDLLLHLIQKAQIDIKDIFVSEITSQFIDYVEKNKYTMDDVSEFLEMAATLVYIKSRHLLPKAQIEEDAGSSSVRDDDFGVSVSRQRFCRRNYGRGGFGGTGGGSAG